ncbi:Curli production assembly/transport component CsgG [Candidatus Thiomargarita nelsonii]|uniref:Curli production assembly/transport component CsgG n=1 Tax=Candidatus Thiomargarita nelsonii TaxID=1003181 RepID=A0A176RXL6_9GAMM|nr:Curli production assembly/transport component CsgG [Candidatus Thiomargarita nelsonii]
MKPRKYKLLIILTLLTLIVGCPNQVLVPPEKYKHESRASVTENVTVYTKGLKCVGKLIKDSGQAGQMTAAIGKIRDKTGNYQGGPGPLTQAASDMAMTALAKISTLNIVGIEGREDLAHIPLSGEQINPVGIGSIGDVVPSHFFLAGSISEYNIDLRTRNWGFSFLRKLLKLKASGSDSVINVAMDLRLVASESGNIIKNSQGELLVVSLQNNLVTRNIGGSIFRTWTDMSGGADFAFKINDPKHLAIREIIDRGVLMLIGQLFEVKWQQCDVKKVPPGASYTKIPVVKDSTPTLSKDPTLMPGLPAPPAVNPADWSQSLIAKLANSLSTKRTLYFNIPKIKNKTTNYFESQLLGALMKNNLFKRLDSMTDLPKSELDQMSAKQLRKKVAASRHGFSIMGALLDAESELSWKVSSSDSKVKVTVFLVDKSKFSVLTESVTFPLSALSNEMAQALMEMPNGFSSQTGLLLFKNDMFDDTDLMIDFVTTHGNGFVSYQEDEKVRFLMRTNRAAYPYVFILDYWGDSQKGITRLYPRSPGVPPKRLDANKVWVFSNDSPIESSDRYMLWVIASEKPIDFPEDLSIEWLRSADMQELVGQGVGVGEYTDMGVIIHTRK